MLVVVILNHARSSPNKSTLPLLTLAEGFGTLSWGHLMMLNCISIHLFSSEISFAPLKVDLRLKGVRRRSGGMSEVVVFKHIEIRASAFLLLDCAV